MKQRSLFLAVMAALLLGLLGGWKIHDWLAIDSCLDGGGAWDHAHQACRNP